jgi:hypothetical protein
MAEAATLKVRDRSRALPSLDALRVRVPPGAPTRGKIMGESVKYGTIITERGNIPPDEPVFLLRAQDVTSPKALRLYRELCEKAGSPQEHLDQIDDTGGAFLQWHADHPDTVKVPGTGPGTGR